MIERILEETEREKTVPRDAFIFSASPPTAGKTTQTIFLTETIKARLIRGRDIVPELSNVLDSSRDLVSDEVFLPSLNNTLNNLTESRIILDNIPRTNAQAQLVKEWGEDNGVKLHLIQLNLTEDEVIERVQKRYVCSQCGESYHNDLKPPRKEDICDKDGTKLIKKKGDDPELVRKGYKHHKQLQSEFLETFNGSATIHQISASGTVYETARRMFVELSPHIFYKGEMAESYFKLRDVIDGKGLNHMFISGMPVFLYGGRALMKDFDIIVPNNEIETIASYLGLKVGVKDSSVAYTRSVDIGPGVEIVSNLSVKVGGRMIPFDYGFLDEESKTTRFMGLECKIMGLEDLILFKAALGRLGPDDWGKHKDDLSDIEGLIGAQNVDWKKLLDRSRNLNMESRLREKVTSLGHEVKIGF